MLSRFLSTSGHIILIYLQAFFYCCLSISCNPNEGPRLSERHNITIELTPWLTFDYKLSTLKLKFRPDDILIDTIQFTVNERKQIIDAFEKNSIGLLTGEHWIGEAKTYPTDQVKMMIYENGKVKSTFHCTPDYDGRNFQNRRVASLSNILLNIIYTKEVYNNMRNESEIRQARYNEYPY